MQIPGSPPSLTASSGSQEYPPSPLEGNSLAKPCDTNIPSVEHDVGEVAKTTVENHESACIFQASATTEIDGSLEGKIVGKDGVNIKALCYLTGTKIGVKDHKSDRNLKILKIKGTFDEIKATFEMASNLIRNCGRNIAFVEQDMGEVPKTTVEYHESACIFQASATTEIDGSLAGEIVGKDGVNKWALGHLTGTKIDVKDHKSDRNLKILKIKGTFDDIKAASEMASDLIRHVTLFSRSTSKM